MEKNLIKSALIINKHKTQNILEYYSEEEASLSSFLKLVDYFILTIIGNSIICSRICFTNMYINQDKYQNAFKIQFKSGSRVLNILHVKNIKKLVKQYSKNKHYLWVKVFAFKTIPEKLYHCLISDYFILNNNNDCILNSY
jgi:hypothetical protein